MSIAKVENEQSFVKEVREHQQSLLREWTIDEEKYKYNPNASSLSDELAVWHRMVWDRAVWLLSTNLKAELR